MTRTSSCESANSQCSKAEQHNHSSLARAFQASSRHISSATCEKPSHYNAAIPDRARHSAHGELTQPDLIQGPSRAQLDGEKEAFVNSKRAPSADTQAVRWHGHSHRSPEPQAIADGKELWMSMAKLHDKIDSISLHLQRLVREQSVFSCSPESNNLRQVLQFISFFAASNLRLHTDYSLYFPAGSA